MTRAGHAYTPAKTREYEGRLRAAARHAFKNDPMQGPMAVVIEAALPIPDSWSKAKQRQAAAGTLHPTGRSDLDNYAKCLDALNGIVWADDAQIVRLQASKVYSDTPGLTVTVEPVTTLVE